MNDMASHKEIKRLVTDMNITTGSGRPSRNSQGICNTPLQPTMSMTLLPETPVYPATVPSLPIVSPLAEVYSLTTAVMQSQILLPLIPQYQFHHRTEIEVLMPCMRLHDRFVDPKGKPLQPGMEIFCENLPFIVSANGKIYNYAGGNMKMAVYS